MTVNFMLSLAKLLEQCPKCHRTTLDEFGKCEISPSKIIRSCQCGYSIEIDIKENIINPEGQRKILLENLEDENKVKENKVENINQSTDVHKSVVPTKQETSNVIKQGVTLSTVISENKNNSQKVQ